MVLAPIALKYDLRRDKTMQAPYRGQVYINFFVFVLLYHHGPIASLLFLGLHFKSLRNDELLVLDSLPDFNWACIGRSLGDSFRHLIATLGQTVSTFEVSIAELRGEITQLKDNRVQDLETLRSEIAKSQQMVSDFPRLVESVAKVGSDRDRDLETLRSEISGLEAQAL
jgi:hypothetical protein